MIETQVAQRGSTTPWLRSSPTRTVLLVLSALTVAWVLGVVVFGLVALVTQLANGDIQPLMYWRTGYTSFTVDSNLGGTVQMGGQGGSTVITATGASAGTVAIYVAATVVGMLTQVALGLLGLRMVSRLRAGLPFNRGAWREVVTLSVAVLGLGIAAQLLGWWSRVALIADSKGTEAFSTSFVPEPLTIALGLAVLLVGVAFRFGEQLQADNDGLV